MLLNGAGKFSKAQRLLYDIVLDVQEACIALCHEGSTLNAIYMYMNSLFAQHLKHVDLIPRELGPVESQQVPILTYYITQFSPGWATIDAL